MLEEQVSNVRSHASHWRQLHMTIIAHRGGDRFMS
jgi:hypothetical protein